MSAVEDRSGGDGSTISATRVVGHRLEAALSAAAQFGPYFALHGTEGTVPLSPQQLYQPERLRSLLAAVADRIGTEEVRVAASTLQYGLAARYWSLISGSWQCGRLVLDLRGLGYVRTAADSVELTLIDRAAWDHGSASADETADRMVQTVVAQLSGLHTALRRVTRIADGLLWGNAASSLVSAARTAGAGGDDGRLGDIVSSILRRAPFVDRLSDVPGGGTRRRSCCLWYRTTEKSHCGDCPLPASPPHDLSGIGRPSAVRR